MLLQIVFVFGCVVFGRGVYGQGLFDSPNFALTPEEVCRLAYPGYEPVNLGLRQQAQLYLLGLTQYKVQMAQECANGIFIWNEAIPYQLVVGTCQDQTDKRLFRILYNVTGRCISAGGRYFGFKNRLLDASVTNEGPAARFVDEVTLEQVRNGLIKTKVALNSGLCSESQGFKSAVLSSYISDQLTLATTEYKVRLRLDGTCPVGVLIYQEQVPEKLLVDVCTNEGDDTLFQVFFNVTSFCIKKGDFVRGTGVVRNDLFSAVISTLPAGILYGTFSVVDSKTPSFLPTFVGMTVEGGKK